jgi:hypothetical protein
MSLLEQFEESGKEVYQVTKNEWIEIHKSHMLEWYNKTGIAEGLQNRLKTDEIESSCFHKEAVTGALKKNIDISTEVLKDYPGLKEKIKAEQERINSISVLTQEIYSTLTEGNKITVNGYKLTVYKKVNNKIICRIYRKQKQGIDLFIGERYNISIGWEEKVS